MTLALALPAPVDSATEAHRPAPGETDTGKAGPGSDFSSMLAQAASGEPARDPSPSPPERQGSSHGDGEPSRRRRLECPPTNRATRPSPRAKESRSSQASSSPEPASSAALLAVQAVASAQPAHRPTTPVARAPAARRASPASPGVTGLAPHVQGKTARGAPLQPHAPAPSTRARKEDPVHRGRHPAPASSAVEKRETPELPAKAADRHAESGGNDRPASREMPAFSSLSPAGASAPEAFPPVTPSEAPPPAAPLFTQAVEDPSFHAVVLPHAAHVTYEIKGEGDLALHLRVREGVADVRVDGTAAQLLNRVTELEAALAQEGLRLGQFDLAQDGRSRPNPEPDDETSPRPRISAPRPSETTDVQDVLAGRLHVKA